MRTFFKNKRSAQTMIELAVFGAVLFFLIGGIASNYISGSFQQNSQLKAMRMALLSSYRSSQAGELSRASASFMLIDDRFTGDVGKYGTTDRQPIVVSGGGSLSAQFMQEGSWNEPGGLPVMDLFINGEQIALRTNSYLQYVILLKTTAVDGADGVQIIEFKPIPDSALTVTTGTSNTCAVTGAPCEMYANYDSCGANNGPCVQQPLTSTYLESELIKQGVSSCAGAPPVTNSPQSGSGSGNVINCNMGDLAQHKRLTHEWLNMADPTAGHGGMPPFYLAIMSNNKDFPGDGSDNAFNYRRDYFPAVIYPDKAKATWCWSWKYFWEPVDGESDTTPSSNVKKMIDDTNGSFPSYDIDGDRREEKIYAVQDMTKDLCTTTGRCKTAYWVKVLDPKGADVDPQKQPKDFVDVNQKPGLRPGMKIYGQTACVATTGNTCQGDGGTYLDVQEGKLFSDGKQVAVSTARKNQYDIVERAYQLNINMVDVDGFKKLNPNIKACPNVQETCFDEGTKTIWIHSRLNDQRGHKWLTDTSRSWGKTLGGP